MHVTSSGDVPASGPTGTRGRAANDEEGIGGGCLGGCSLGWRREQELRCKGAQGHRGRIVDHRKGACATKLEQLQREKKSGVCRRGIDGVRAGSRRGVGQVRARSVHGPLCPHPDDTPIPDTRQSTTPGDWSHACAAGRGRNHRPETTPGPGSRHGCQAQSPSRRRSWTQGKATEAHSDH